MSIDAEPVPGTAAGGTGGASAPPAIALIGIDKRFGTVHANRDVSVDIARGTVHGIVGENGAGKSTLMSILYGFYQADRGEIRVNGQPCRIGRPEDALAAGIGMVHQHFMLVDPFTVLENVLLGREGGARLSGGLADARATLERLAREHALEVDLDTPVGALPVGLQQRVEILKALYRGAEILILDEPTGVLTPQEADHLFHILRSLRDQGRTIVLITHKLREIMAITDAVTVMRRGAVVATVPTAETDRDALAELMVGRKVLLRVDKTPAKPGPVLLDVAGLSVADGRGAARVKEVSFQVRRGEILAIAGVSGNGQSELMAAIAGIRHPTAGRLAIAGRPIARTADAHDTRRLGIAHVPEDRQREGLVTSFEANECAILGYHDDPAYNGPVLMHHRAIVADCVAKMQDYDVRPCNAHLPGGNFSGGNQQKLIVAREIERDPDLLIVGQPTRGVDIGAIEFIHQRLIALRDRGKAILLVSVELDEVMSLADRILVMFDGRIVGEIAAADADERTLGLMMAGIAPEAPPPGRPPAPLAKSA